MVDRLGADPTACVRLDDRGANLRPARDMGMTTIEVVNGPQAITELGAAAGLLLRLNPLAAVHKPSGVIIR
jgi:putative hydrolase of the HAD superfamily